MARQYTWRFRCPICGKRYAKKTYWVRRTRAVYLRGLLYAGIVDPLASPPTDERLWETHPINASADLYED